MLFRHWAGVQCRFVVLLRIAMKKYPLIFVVLVSLWHSLSWAASYSTREQFYITSAGEKIMDPSSFTEEIEKMLLEENQFVLTQMILGKYDVLYEVGCADSSRANDVVKLGVDFFGIDINPCYVEKSNRLFEEKKIQMKAQTSLFSANNLNSSTYQIANYRKALIVYPFNLLGNLDDFHLILINMINIGQDFCFSTYKINPIAWQARNRYYSKCGCEGIRYSTTPIGDLFDSEDGLHSAAFKVGYLTDLIFHLLETKNKRAKVLIKDLASIGSIIFVGDIQEQ